MKKQLLTLLAVLLTCTTAIALTTLPGMLAGNTVHLSVTIDPEGAGTVDRPERDIVTGGNATFTAVANAGYSFDGWYVNGALVSHDNPYQFKNNTADLNIVAKFNTLAASTLTLSPKPGCEPMGSVNVTPEGTVDGYNHKLNTGTKVTVSATPNTGYEFVQWEDGAGNVLSTSTSYSFTVNNDMTVYGVFQPLENYHADLIAFPGCEGWGRFTTGGRMVDGRGSKVYYVTRLDDTGEEGSFRWAVTTGDDTPRTVLFKVSGTIYLTSRLSCRPNITIAGQTAPGGGICLAGYQLKLTTNSIVRYIRFRAGDLPNSSMSMLDVENCSNIVLDHCTFSWSMEENITIYDTKYTTVQWCIFSEPLYDSRNTKGNRAYGAQWGGEHATMHHCLFAHCNSRAPRFNGVRPNVNDRQVDGEFINNVIFNWGSHNSVYGGENSNGGATDYNRIYMINNYYKPGPATKNGANGSRYFVRPTGGNINEVGQWYLKGNKFETGSKWAGTDNIWSDDVLKKVNEDNYWGYLSSDKGRAIDFWSISPSTALYNKALLTALPEGYELTITPEPADVAYQKVVLQAGASLPRYDEVDARILREAAGEQDPQFGGARGAKMGIIDSPYDITLKEHDQFAALYEGDKAADNKEIDVTCYPRLQMDDTDCRVVDTDGDGLPDAYETEVGLNPNDATDGGRLTVSGYSNLEVFLNGVANYEIDATKYTRHQSVTRMDGFNAIVGEGGFATVQDAIDAAPADATPYYIFVKAGTYEGHVQINRANVHLTGQSRTGTVLSWNKVYNEDGGNVDTNATVNVTGSDVSFDNLTIRNTRQNAGQALALYTKGDRIVLTNCDIVGWQDTYRTGNDGQRHLLRNCKLTGTTDFIYNRGEVFFDACTLHVLQSQNVIIAPDHVSPNYGYVFNNCVITAANSTAQTHLGRPWGDTPKASFLNTKLSEGVTIPAAGWRDMDGLPTQMAEYNTMDADGNAVDLSQRKTSFTNDAGTTRSSKAILGKVEADSYKLDYVLRGNDEWDADWQAFILPAPELGVSGNNVWWNDPTGYAQCFLVVADGVATVTTATSITGSNVTVQCISAFGVTGEVASSDNPTGIAQTKTDTRVTRREFFTADGRQVERLQHGLTVVRKIMADGTIRTTKVVSK